MKVSRFKYFLINAVVLRFVLVFFLKQTLNIQAAGYDSVRDLLEKPCNNPKMI